jgi:hypothetical protein
MRKSFLLLVAFMTGILLTKANDASTITVIDDLSAYVGGDNYIYNRADGKVYVLNNIGNYEEYGIIERVNSLNLVADTDIEYIETTSDMQQVPYINTGYVFKANTRVVIDFEINEHVRGYEAPFGARQSSFRNNAFVFFSRFNNSNNGNFNRSGVETNGENRLRIGTRYIVDAFEQTCSIYKHEDMSSPYSTIVTTGAVDDGVNPMFIFDLNTAGIGGAQRDNSVSLMKLYNFKIYEGEQLVMDLQPIVSPTFRPGVRDKVSGRRFFSAIDTDFYASPDAPMGIEPSGITAYEGKIVEYTVNGHAYQYTNGEWTDLGVMTVPISDTTYKNMLNWTYPEDKAPCFAGISYDEVNDKNHIEAYTGGPNHEPFFCAFPTEAGERYQLTFNYSCDAWDTWNTDKEDPNNYMRAVVLNTAIPSKSFTENGNQLGGTYGVLARYQLPHEATVDHKVLMEFTAEQDNEYILLQYGNVEDNIPYNFDYDYITVSKIASPKQYSLTPYLSALIWIAENTDIVSTNLLMKKLQRAVSKARGVLTSDDVDAQREAYEELLAALEAALNYTASPTKGDIVINEVMAANPDVFMSPAYNFDGWVELYNTTDQAFTLGGCYMSDDPANPKKWYMPTDIGKIAPNGHMTVWLGSNDIRPQQGTIKLNCEGGQLILSDTEGEQIADCNYPEAVVRCSYARTTDGGDTWSWTGQPTPGSTNNNAPYSTLQLPAPLVSPDGCLFEGQLSISVNIPEGATLRYTTDGTTPTMENGETSTTGLFTCDATSNYRFRLYKDNYLPSAVTSRSYIVKDRDYVLPIISIATDQRFLYDNTIGVYVKGNNGRTGNGQSTPANWNMPWDRPVAFQYLLPETNEAVVNQECDFKISGGWTRANNPKAFKLKADRKFDGRNAFEYPFFSMKAFNKNKTLQVRAGGNDSGSRIKDAAIQNIIQRSGINLDVISYEPAVHFINGQYRGLINVREPNNKDYAYANFGLSKEEIEVFEQSPDSGRYMMVGTMETLNRLDQLSETPNDPAAYEEIKQLLDIDEYINYMAAELYLGSWDWPDNNVKGYRKLDNGKYRIVMFDMDAAFDTDGRAYGESGGYLGGNFFRWIDDMQWHRFDYIYDTGQRMYGEQKFCTFFLNMLENEDFRRRLIDAFCIVGGSVFDEERANAILAELGARVRPTMAWESMSPDGSLNEIRSKLSNRMETKVDHMLDYERLQLNVDDLRQVTLSTNISQAKILVNNIEVPYSSFKGYLFSPATLRTEAPSSFTFEGWKMATTTENAIVDAGATWSYYDQGSLDGEDWTSPGYDTREWASGSAPLGYGKEVNTALDYGGDANNKYPTYYFRTNAALSAEPTSSTQISLSFVADDGFIIYVNGKEAGRYNMPAGQVSFNTFSTTDAKSNPDKGTMKLNPTLFKMGYNTIAVEVHNNSARSSDILWQGTITCKATTSSNDIYSTEKVIPLPDDITINLQACYKPLTRAERVRNQTPDVCINEVSASNSIFQNEYFKRNDWIELYNNTDNDIDIEGAYLSDKYAEPQKWQITKGQSQASTIIPAHGFLIIWCDKLDPITELHSPFKLSAEGGDVIITDKNTRWKDAMHYEAHNGDETACRYPDGGNDVYITSMPTIAKSNLYSSYFANVEQVHDGISQPRLVSNNNGLKIRYAAGKVVVRSEQRGPGVVAIYTPAGQQIMTQAITISTDRTEVDVTALPAGTYVARATDSEGNHAATKFIK